MGVYINLKCHHCGHSLTGGYTPNSFSVGPPYLRCSQCQNINVIENKQTEWQVMRISRKLAILWLCLFWGVAFGIPIWIAFSYILKTNNDDEPILIIFSGFAGIIINVALLLNQIRQSNARMSDARYNQFVRSIPQS